MSASRFTFLASFSAHQASFDEGAVPCSGHDDPLGPQSLSSVAHPLGAIILPCDCEHDLSSNDPLLDKAKQFGDSALARKGGVQD